MSGTTLSAAKGVAAAQLSALSRLVPEHSSHKSVVEPAPATPFPMVRDVPHKKAIVRAGLLVDVGF